MERKYKTKLKFKILIRNNKLKNLINQINSIKRKIVYSLTQVVSI